MKCGDFRAKANQRINIQTLVSVSDDYGGATTSWDDKYEVWAIMKPMSGQEKFNNDLIQSKVNHKIVVRYIDALKNTKTAAKYRIKYGDRIFSIVYVRNLDEELKLEGRSFQEFYCVENDSEFE